MLATLAVLLFPLVLLMQTCLSLTCQPRWRWLKRPIIKRVSVRGWRCLLEKWDTISTSWLSRYDQSVSPARILFYYCSSANVLQSHKEAFHFALPLYCAKTLTTWAKHVKNGQFCSNQSYLVWGLFLSDHPSRWQRVQNICKQLHCGYNEHFTFTFYSFFVNIFQLLSKAVPEGTSKNNIFNIFIQK